MCVCACVRACVCHCVCSRGLLPSWLAWDRPTADAGRCCLCRLQRGGCQGERWHHQIRGRQLSFSLSIYYFRFVLNFQLGHCVPTLGETTFDGNGYWIIVIGAEYAYRAQCNDTILVSSFIANTSDDQLKCTHPEGQGCSFLIRPVFLPNWNIKAKLRWFEQTENYGKRSSWKAMVECVDRRIYLRIYWRLTAPPSTTQGHLRVLDRWNYIDS